MKKLYRRAGTVHPSPPTVSDHLSFLPAAILSLAAALSLEDREVLAYLISSSSNNNNKSNNTYLNSSSSSPYNSPRGTNRGGGGDHPARFNCSCFRCYTSYWVRWDESPNRDLIHEIIDAFEEDMLAKTKAAAAGSSSSSSKPSRKERRNQSKRVVKKKDQLVKNNNNKVEETSSVVVSSDHRHCGDVDDDEENKGSVRRFVSFVGERIWGIVLRS